eukprot:TRINITY_DN3744_c0_g1_i1.p1 TRINITY_DN3744_c0_g1~~TRINITY_DN3744_c0_g1_i1.p1  ORF type:complete len:351 (+),score=66.12 TRINITY_DN3744_c0_g1_i1:49-1101(+)
MKLDASGLQFLGGDDARVLTCVEMGCRNHEIVPTALVISLSKLTSSKTTRALSNLHGMKLLSKDKSAYHGYKLTYMGYDYLALRALANQKVLARIGNKLGVGKESDIFYAEAVSGDLVVVKLHRLGRTSFRAVKNKRDYLRNRHTSCWMYMSRLAAETEYQFMKVLHIKGFPVPEPLGWSRHCVVMSLIEGYPLSQVSALEHPQKVYEALMELLVRLAECGLVHGDFNEFNIMVNENHEVTVIDFPQMISISHPNARDQFCHDVQCVRTYFLKKFRLDFNGDVSPDKLFQSVKRKDDLDVQMRASGWKGSLELEFSDEGEDLDEEEVLKNEESTAKTQTGHEDEMKENGG